MIPHQRSGTPRDQFGPARANSALGLTTTLPLFNASAPPPKPKSSASVPYIKPPTPAPQTRLTTPALYPSSEKPALRSKTPTPAPPSKITTPKSGCPTADPSTTNRTSAAPPTDYNPAEPVRPMPGLKSPSTEPDSIFGGAFGSGARHLTVAEGAVHIPWGTLIQPDMTSMIRHRRSRSSSHL